MINVAVVFGGRSVEHEVSVITGMQIIENMDKSKFNPIPIFIDKDGKWLSGEVLKDFRTFKNQDFSKAIEVFFKGNKGDFNLYTLEEGGFFSKGGLKAYEKIDVVFPALHGTYGEDGAIQGYLELLDIPYVGCGVMSAAVGMDKVIMKEVFKTHNIPMTEFTYFYRSKWEKNKDDCVNESEKLGYPLFVKPANLGSSIGISKANNREELENAIEVASHYDRKIIVEKAAIDPREINAAVMGYEDDIIVSPCEEPIGWKDILSYEDKYIGSNTKGAKTGKNSRRNIPANISEDLKNEVEKLAKVCFKSIDAMGTARIDFLIEGDKVYVNEINTLPGSISFYLWEAAGIPMKDLITKLIDLSQVRSTQKTGNIYSYDSNLYMKSGYGAKL